MNMVALDMVDAIKEFETDDRFLIMPVDVNTPYRVVNGFWEDCFRADTLKYRWAHMPNISPGHATTLTLTPSTSTHYLIVNPYSKSVVAEIALDLYCGKSARLHFCLHPATDSTVGRYLGRAVTDEILNLWKDQNNITEPYVEVLYGMTPILNRAACIFVLRSGFKKLAVLPYSCDYLGEVCDAMLTTKERIRHG